MENANNTPVASTEEIVKHSYNLPPTTICLKPHTVYLFSLCYNLETNTNDGKIHYYCGRYRKEKNGEPVFDELCDTETNKCLGKKTITNFILLKPQVIKCMGVFRGKIIQEEEQLREKHKQGREKRDYPSVNEILSCKQIY
jgi:hypothetical protein